MRHSLPLTPIDTLRSHHGTLPQSIYHLLRCPLSHLSRAQGFHRGILRHSPRSHPMGRGLHLDRREAHTGNRRLSVLRRSYPPCSLLSDLHKRLTGAPPSDADPTPTPAELEAGAATRLHDLAVLEAEVAGVDPPAAPTSAVVKLSALSKVASLMTSTISSLFIFFKSDTVSLDKPLLENAGAALLYILRGLEVLFVAMLFLGFVAWSRKRRSQAATEAFAMEGPHPAAPVPSVEVLFDESTIAEAVPATKEDREFKEAEKA
ncbi:hypothetical protein C8R43DRAFT_340973 [Mycena crocata]|nr:hypothetical protein C8R43DRAFT_340973 [Mycena crocata]